MRGVTFAIVFSVGAAIAASMGSAPARADQATDCKNIAEDAKELQNASGRWIGERRFLNARRKELKRGTPAYAGIERRSQISAQKEGELSTQLFDMGARISRLRGTPCAGLAEADMAFLKAKDFLEAPIEPPPLPPGYCRISPDTTVAPAPCPAKPDP
jgi:hypothetical protein